MIRYSLIILLLVLTGCGTVERLDDRRDMVLDATITFLEVQQQALDERKKRLVERLKLEHEESGRRIDRLDKLWGEMDDAAERAEKALAD